MTKSYYALLAKRAEEQGLQLTRSGTVLMECNEAVFSTSDENEMAAFLAGVEWRGKP